MLEEVGLQLSHCHSMLEEVGLQLSLGHSMLGWSYRMTGQHWGQSSCPMSRHRSSLPLCSKTQLQGPPGVQLFLEEVGLEVGLGVGLACEEVLQQAGRSPKLAAVEPVPVLCARRSSCLELCPAGRFAPTGSERFMPG